MVFIVLGHGPFLCTTTNHLSYFSLFHFQVFFVLCPKAEPTRACPFWGPRDSATAPLAINSRSSTQMVPFQPLKLDPLICSVPSNSSVLCFLPVQMDCTDMSGNAEVICCGFLPLCMRRFMAVSRLPRIWLGTQWIGWELGWTLWVAVEQGLLVSRMVTYKLRTWWTVQWPLLSSMQSTLSSACIHLFWLSLNWFYEFIYLPTTRLWKSLKQWSHIILFAPSSSNHTKSA